MDVMLVQSCVAMGSELIKHITPTTEHNMAGKTCLLGKSLTRGIIDCKSAALIYGNLYWYRDIERRYKEGGISVSVMESQIDAEAICH